MLSEDRFKIVVESTPLVSIDLCLMHEGQILLGKRNHRPLKGQWFTPGGRIRKNESWKNGLRRIAFSELGIKVNDINSFILMGIWDHFYKDSMFDECVSSHYINIPHYTYLECKPDIQTDDQHHETDWFNLEEVAVDFRFHEYMRIYANWLIKKGDKYD